MISECRNFSAGICVLLSVLSSLFFVLCSLLSTFFLRLHFLRVLRGSVVNPCIPASAQVASPKCLTSRHLSLRAPPCNAPSHSSCCFCPPLGSLLRRFSPTTYPSSLTS